MMWKGFACTDMSSVVFMSGIVDSDWSVSVCSIRLRFITLWWRYMISFKSAVCLIFRLLMTLMALGTICCSHTGTWLTSTRSRRTTAAGRGPTRPAGCFITTSPSRTTTASASYLRFTLKCECDRIKSLLVFKWFKLVYLQGLNLCVVGWWSWRLSTI